MPYRTVLFDLDGTLIDSIRLILDSYHHTMATHGLPPRSDAEWLAGVGTPLWVQLKEWADDPERMELLIATYREYNIRNHDTMVSAYPGVVDMVRAVRRAGKRTGLVTSKNRMGALRGLRRVGLEEDIDVIVAADDVTNPKPDPEPIQLALTRLGESPELAIYVGDSVHDMEAGRAAGIATGAVLWGPFARPHLAPSQPTHWFEHPEDVLRLLDVEPVG